MEAVKTPKQGSAGEDSYITLTREQEGGSHTHTYRRWVWGMKDHREMGVSHMERGTEYGILYIEYWNF